MSEALAIVQQILDEHAQIHKNFQTLDQVSGDVEAAARLGSEKTKDYFVPKGLETDGEGLKKWKSQLEAIDRGLKAHFKREETALANAFIREGTPELAQSLNQLLAEHASLNQHVAKLLKDADDIASGGARIEVWEGKGWGMKSNILKLQSEIEAHAERERVLLGLLKSHLHKE
ncbi:MAG: hemerythrin domain-containing protein [Dehalococcoidia bacterium]|jgi:hypothetical protein|nr:hemerythrin domain-containing protein [Dehalococcoidia bacterium]